ncbi:MAG TPA: hypothetical protein DCR70_05065 [Phycisphaerales bacterium]|nr:hypothetical protein [Phycisphaerales bacterium]
MIFGAAIVVGTALLVPVGYDLSDKAFNRGGWSSNDWETAGGIVGGGVGGVAGARAAGTGFRGGPSAGSARGGPIAAGMRRVHTGPRIVPPGQGIRLASLSRATVERNGFRFTERYHRRLWDMSDGGRPAPSLFAREILDATGGKGTPITDEPYPGFLRYEALGWEMTYNPGTREV